MIFLCPWILFHRCIIIFGYFSKGVFQTVKGPRDSIKNVDTTTKELEAEGGTLTKLTLKIKIWICTIWLESPFSLKQILHWEVGTISRLPSTLLWIFWLCGPINLVTNPVYFVRNDRVSWGLATFQFELLSRNQVNSNDRSPSEP